MKICHVTSLHDWKDDRIFERACVGLSELGVDVHLVASNQLNHYVSNEGQKNQESYSVIQGVTIHWLKERKGIKRRIISSYEATRMAIRINPDIIHFHDPDLLPFMWYAQLSGHKVIYDVHENYASRFIRPELPKQLGILIGWFYRKVENFLIRSFSGSVFVTDSLMKLCKPDNSKSIVVGNLPYLKLLNQTNLPDRKFQNITVVTSGIISPARNAMETVIAAENLHRKNACIDFLFVGKYAADTEAKINKIVEKEGLSNVRTEGMVAYLENFKRVGMAHIGCVFYEDNANNRIGLPNRAFEYMYSGLALIGDDFPEIRRLISETQCGIIVNSKNPEQLADSIQGLANNPELLKRLGENGQKAVKEKYNFENALAILVNFYKKINQG